MMQTPRRSQRTASEISWGSQGYTGFGRLAGRACRLYGFYVSRMDHWWCANIQALYEAGAYEGVILGNQGAIKQALHQQCSAAKSLAERLEHIW